MTMIAARHLARGDVLLVADGGDPTVRVQIVEPRSGRRTTHVYVALDRPAGSYRLSIHPEDDAARYDTSCRVWPNDFLVRVYEVAPDRSQGSWAENLI